MPDGKAYRGMRGGNWYNGENGHGRVSNRNPSYFRGPKDPDHPYYHLGFRVVLPVAAESRPVIKPTPVQKVERGGGGSGAAGGRPPKDSNRQRKVGSEAGGAPQPQAAPASDEPKPPRSGSFSLTSAVVKADGLLPVEFTGDGAGISPPLAWKGAPAGTKAYALIMHHVAPDQVKWYWILYNIPATTQGLPKDAKVVGTLGGNSVNNRIGYAPPHSKGPGLKTYICTVYALSETLSLKSDSDEVTRDVLLAAMKGKILDSAELKISYARPDSAIGAEEKKRGGGERPPREPRDSRNGPERKQESNAGENP